MTSAVGTIALDRAPRLNTRPHASDSTLRIAWLTPAQLDPRSVSGMSEIAISERALRLPLRDRCRVKSCARFGASSWQRNEDGTSYTLQLVENARFHDGSSLTARDVVWSIEWQLDAGGTIADVLAGHRVA